MREYTMLARDLDGLRYDRPREIRETATRVLAWQRQPECCDRCHREASHLIGGTRLCGSCRQEQSDRICPFRPSGVVLRHEAGDASAGLTLSGRAIVFNSQSEDLGGFREIIRPAAAERTFAEGIDVRALWSHDSAQTLGRMSAGTLVLTPTTRGITAAIAPPRWAGPQLETVERRDVTGMSFGFEAVTDDWHLEDSTPIREVLDMRIFEVSAVSFPAYPATTLAVRHPGARARDDGRARALRLAGVY